MAAAVAPATAEGGRAPVRVSVQVVRSCRVTTDRQVSVDCGTRPQPIQVSATGVPPVARTVTDHTAVAPASVHSVTIHF